MPAIAGMANVPICRSLITYIIASAIFVTATDTKYYFQLMPDPHLFGTPYSGQWWRLLAWPLVYTNSTEMLFGAMAVYQMRVIERIWGSRKFASFLLTTAPWTIVLPPLILLMLRPLTVNQMNFLPAGPTALLFALLAQYHAAVPYTFRYRLATYSPSMASSGTPSVQQSRDTESGGLLLTSKATSYLIPCQLALSQLPGSLIPAVAGWVVGYLWRAELLPTLPGRQWRVPAWLVGETNIDDRGIGRQSARGGVESLRRRMQQEGGVGSSSGSLREDSGRRRA